MEALAHIPMGEGQFEEWFLTKVSGENMPVVDMQNALRELRRAGMIPQTNGWAELMEDTLLEQGKLDDAVNVLRMRALWNNGDPSFRDACAKRLTFVFRNDPVRKKFVTNLGIDKGVALTECFRRLETLQNIKPGLLCMDKTWGIGSIKNVDAFYERVAIDFTRKMGHEMSFAYAAETLQLVGDEHLMARKYRDAIALAALAETEAAELVRIALRSYGPLPVMRLQEILSDGIVKPESWKTFWEAARKALKSDPLIVIPSKRSEPIIMLEKAKAYDAAWFTALAGERTAEGVFASLDKLADNAKPGELDASSLRVIGERLAFLMRGFGDKDMNIRVQVVVAARQWMVSVEQVDWMREAGVLIEPVNFMAAALAITSKRLDALLRLLSDHDNARLYDTISGAIPIMTMNVLNSCMSFMLESGQEAPCMAVFKELVGMRKAGVEVLFWLAKRPDRLEAWNLGTTGDLAFQILPAMEKTYNGERLRAANQLGELVQQREWLESAANAMNEVQRTSFIRYLRAVMGKTSVDTQAMIGRIVRVYPELVSLLTDKHDAASAEATTPKGGLTSWRSYRLRQKLLEKIVNEDIPQNSRDIGVARSYGDLRENFEYKTAKEQQRILMHRSAELETDLNTVHGTDFATCSTEAAGMGTTVTLEMDDGRKDVFSILGEWDQDAEKGIISCSSRLGKVLTGHRVGEVIDIPGDKGDVKCRILAVSALSEDVCMWAKGV
ncbi:MAG: GreA/GreB family elongation factor [bacterium]